MTLSDYVGHFSLWGDFDADAITSRLGLSPSNVYPKGETSLTGSPALITTWDLHCPSHQTADEQIEHLLALLWPRANVLSELTVCFTGEFNVVGDGYLCLKPTTMQKLVQLNLTLNCFCLEDGANIPDDERVGNSAQDPRSATVQKGSA